MSFHEKRGIDNQLRFKKGLPGHAIHASVSQLSWTQKITIVDEASTHNHPPTTAHVRATLPPVCRLESLHPHTGPSQHTKTVRPPRKHRRLAAKPTVGVSGQGGQAFAKQFHMGKVAAEQRF